MIGLFFEVEPKPGHRDVYFDIAAALRPELEKNPGLLFIDRFRSLQRAEVILSHQHWADEASLDAWREHTGHRAAQIAGRETHFADYRIRVAPEVSTSEAGEGDRLLLSVAREDEAYTDAGGEAFQSVYREGAFITVIEPPCVREAAALIEQAGGGTHLFRVTRDYSRFRRDEAPRP